jgi:putative Holliday junction resolvase
MASLRFRPERSRAAAERRILRHYGRRGPEAEKAIAFANALSEAAGIPVETLDERWTSQEAERMLQGISKKRRKSLREGGAVDEAAASIILRTYLGARQSRASGAEQSS